MAEEQDQQQDAQAPDLDGRHEQAVVSRLVSSSFTSARGIPQVCLLRLEPLEQGLRQNGQSQPGSFLGVYRVNYRNTVSGASINGSLGQSNLSKEHDQWKVKDPHSTLHTVTSSYYTKIAWKPCHKARTSRFNTVKDKKGICWQGELISAETDPSRHTRLNRSELDGLPEFHNPART